MLRSRLDEEHLKALGQLIRYVFSGGAVTLLHLAVYWAVAQPLRIAPLIANAVAQIVSTCTGYVVHSRWTFQGHGKRDNLARTGGRFLIVTAFGFLLNSFWV